ncbi:MAG: DUF2141 domain-containing protein [Flavobacterium sp.]
MEYIKYFFACAIIFISGTVVSQNTVTVDVPNIKGDKGTIQIAVFNKSESFPKVGGEYKLVQFKISDGKSKFTIKDLPDGEYAIAIHHDENSDGKMNTNMIGIPKEGYAFSKNFKPKFSAPKFSDCAIRIDSDQKMTVKMIY